MSTLLQALPQPPVAIAADSDLSAMECLVAFLGRAGRPVSLENILRSNSNLLTFDLRSHMKGMCHYGETSRDCFMRIAARYRVQVTRLEPAFEQHLGDRGTVSNAPEWVAMAYRTALARWIRAARRASTGLKSAVLVSLSFRFSVDDPALRREWFVLESLRLNRSLEELSRITVRDPSTGRSYKWDFLAVRMRDALMLQAE